MQAHRLAQAYVQSHQTPFFALGGNKARALTCQAFSLALMADCLMMCNTNPDLYMFVCSFDFYRQRDVRV